MVMLWSQRRLLFWVEAKHVNVVEPVPTFVLGWRQKMQCSELMPTLFLFLSGAKNCNVAEPTLSWAGAKNCRDAEPVLTFI